MLHIHNIHVSRRHATMCIGVQAATGVFAANYGMRSSHVYMMALIFAPLNSLRSDPATSSTNEDVSSAAQKKINLDVMFSALELRSKKQ